MIFRLDEINNLEQRFRSTFINSLAGIKQAFLIGTKSKDGCSNLAIFNSLIHIGSNPPLWGFLCRPDNVKRDTLSNILGAHQYTINFVSASDYKKAHQTSAKYDKDISEFSECGFTESFHNNYDVPFAAEAFVKVGMKFEQKIDIAINDTKLIIGSIEHIEIDESINSADGFVALDKVNNLACAGLDAYYETKLIERLAYARPDEQVKNLQK